MVKVWKVIGIIAAIFLVLGLICVGVGFLTGGDLDRIKSLLESNYGLDNLRKLFQELLQKLLGLNPLV